MFAKIKKLFKEVFGTPEVIPMTPHEAMVAAIHVVAEKGKCMDSKNEFCVYYNPVNGKRCIIGEFFHQMGLPDTEAQMGVYSLSDPDFTGSELHCDFLQDYDIGTLEQLQTVHDDIDDEEPFNGEAFREECMNIINKHSIKL